MKNNMKLVRKVFSKRHSEEAEFLKLGLEFENRGILVCEQHLMEKFLLGCGIYVTVKQKLATLSLAIEYFRPSAEFLFNSNVFTRILDELNGLAKRYKLKSTE